LDDGIIDAFLTVRAQDISKNPTHIRARDASLRTKLTEQGGDHPEAAPLLDSLPAAA
jgi:hypothetical protein